MMVELIAPGATPPQHHTCAIDIDWSFKWPLKHASISPPEHSKLTHISPLHPPAPLCPFALSVSFGIKVLAQMHWNDSFSTQSLELLSWKLGHETWMMNLSFLLRKCVCVCVLVSVRGWGRVATGSFQWLITLSVILSKEGGGHKKMKKKRMYSMETGR